VASSANSLRPRTRFQTRFIILNIRQGLKQVNGLEEGSELESAVSVVAFTRMSQAAVACAVVASWTSSVFPLGCKLSIWGAKIFRTIGRRLYMNLLDHR